jgi:hypothetical protein
MEDDSFDVVTSHHKRNRVPKPPAPSHLAAIRQSGQAQASGDSDDGSSKSGTESDSHRQKKSRAKRHTHGPYSATSTNPKRLRYYPSQWRDVLEEAKFKFRRWLGITNAFPDPKNEEHRKVAAECISQAIFEHQESGGRVEDREIALYFCCMVTHCLLGFYPNCEKFMIHYVRIFLHIYDCNH